METYSKSSGTLNDAKWIEGLKNNNPSIVEELFIEFHQRIYQKLYTFLREKKEAEIILTQTFIYAWKHRSEVEGFASVELFLFHCATKCFCNFMCVKLPKLVENETMPDVSVTTSEKMVGFFEFTN